MNFPLIKALLSQNNPPQTTRHPDNVLTQYRQVNATPVLFNICELNKLLQCNFDFPVRCATNELIDYNKVLIDKLFNQFGNKDIKSVYLQCLPFIGVKLNQFINIKPTNQTEELTKIEMFCQLIIDVLLHDNIESFQSIICILTVSDEQFNFRNFDFIRLLFMGMSRLCVHTIGAHERMAKFISSSNEMPVSTISKCKIPSMFINKSPVNIEYHLNRQQVESSIKSSKTKGASIFTLHIIKLNPINMINDLNGQIETLRHAIDFNLIRAIITNHMADHLMVASTIEQDIKLRNQETEEIGTMKPRTNPLHSTQLNEISRLREFYAIDQNLNNLIHQRLQELESGVLDDGAFDQMSQNFNHFVERLQKGQINEPHTLPQQNVEADDNMKMETINGAVVIEDNVKFESSNLNYMRMRSNRCTDFPQRKCVEGKFYDVLPEFSEYTQCLGKNLLEVEQWRQLYGKFQAEDPANAKHDYLVYVQLYSNTQPWKHLTLNLDAFANQFKEQSAWKLGEYFLTLMKSSKIPDPQLRLTVGNCADDDSALTIEGFNRRLFKVTSIEASIKSQLTGQPLMYQLPGETMPIICGVDLRNDFEGVTKSVCPNLNSMRTDAIKSRMSRMCQHMMMTQEHDPFFEAASGIANEKLQHIDTTQKLFKPKYKGVNDEILTSLELMNRMTCRQMLSECFEEMENMAKLRSLIFNIKVNLKRKLDKGEEVDEFVDTEKMITVKRSEYGVTVKEIETIIDTTQFAFKGKNYNCYDLLCIKSNSLNDYLCKTYGPLTIHTFRKRISADRTLQKYHVVFQLKTDEGMFFSKCFIFNPSVNDCAMKNECTLLHLKGSIDNRTIIYHALDCYVRNPNFRKSDMFTTLEFAVKEYKRQFTCWNQLVEKWRNEVFCYNSSDLLFAYYTYLLATDPNPHVPSLFLLFHAPNRQTPLEIMKCCNATLRPAVPADAMKGETVSEFLEFIKSNVDDLFDRQALSKLSEPLHFSTDDYATTASSNESIVISETNAQCSHLATCIVSKDEKFKVYNNVFKDKSGNIHLSDLIDMFDGEIPRYLIVSKQNNKSMREIYLMDPLTAQGAATETEIAKIISKAERGDLIMKENDKNEILSGCIDEANNRIKTNQSGNILVFEGDGTKYNQHMSLEMFAKMYEALNDSIYGGDNTSEWLLYLNAFYNYYRRKQMIVDLTKYRKEILVEALSMFSKSSYQQLPEFSVEMIKFIMALRNSKTISVKLKSILEVALNYQKRSITDLIAKGKVKQEDVEYCNGLEHDDKMKNLERLMCPYMWCKCLSIMEKVHENEFLKPHMKAVVQYLFNAVSSCFRNGMFDEAEFEKFETLWENFQDQHLIIPSTYGMAQGILACSSSVFSSLALRFVCSKLKQENLIDWGLSYSTSDDMLIVMTTKSQCDEEFQNHVRLRIETILSQLNIKCNKIKSSIQCNPSKLVFNSLYYYLNERGRSTFAKKHKAKLPAIGRFWKNVFDEPDDEACVNFNCISTNLKLLFDSFNYTPIDRYMFIQNGRAISNAYNLNNYFYGSSNHFIKEFFCSWPSSHESIDPLSEYTLFNRKEIDLMWYVYTSCLASINVVDQKPLNQVKILTDNLSCEDLKLNEDGSITLFSGGKYFEVSEEVFNSGTFRDSIISLNLPSTAEFRISVPVEFNSKAELLNCISTKFLNPELHNRVDITNFVSPECAFSNFLEIYGWNLTYSPSNLGFRIHVKPMKTKRRETSALASVQPNNTDFSPLQMYNYFTHLGQDPRQKERYAIRFKIQGSPHIVENGQVFNYRFFDFPAVDQNDKTYFRIPITDYVHKMLQLNPQYPMIYGYLPDETQCSYLTKTAMTELLFQHELFQVNDTSQFLQSLMMMRLSHSVKFMKRTELITGMISPYVEGKSFGGYRCLPNENERLLGYISRNQPYDPWIVCQMKAGQNAWKHCGLLIDVKTMMYYFVQGNSIRSRFKLINGRAEEIPIAASDMIPSCLITYNYECDEQLRSAFLTKTMFRDGKWHFDQQKHKLAKQRCVPMFTLTAQSFLNQLSPMRRMQVNKYLNKMNAMEEEICQIRFTVK